jgi:hypothetical protein
VGSCSSQFVHGDEDGNGNEYEGGYNCGSENDSYSSCLLIRVTHCLKVFAF